MDNLKQDLLTYKNIQRSRKPFGLCTEARFSGPRVPQYQKTPAEALHHCGQSWSNETLPFPAQEIMAADSFVICL